MSKIIKNVKDKIIRVAIYIRVSTEEQAKHGYSIESQKSRLIEWAKEHNYQVVDIYADEGKSARTKISNRKELLRLLDDVKSDKIDRIVIWRLDRWFRNVADYYRIQDLLDKYNVDWECSDEEFNTSTSNGRLYLNIKLSIAQNESDQTSDRIKFNFENMVRNKRPISGALPIGYKIEGEKQNKRVVKDPELSQMAIDMFDKFEETLSLRATTQYLHDNYPQRPILYERVKHMLKNSMYHGVYRGVEEYCEPYISKERHQKIIDLINKNHKPNKHSDHFFIFSGLIRCYDCGRRMGGSSAGRNHVDGTRIRYGTYKCCNHFLDCRCSNNHTVNEDKLEKWLISNFLVMLNDYVISVESVEEKQVINKNVNKVERLKDKLDRLNELYLDGRITKEKYDNDYNATQLKIQELDSVDVSIKKRNLEKYKKILKSNTILDLYNKLTRENKRLFWYEYIDHIVQDADDPVNNWHVFFK
jgi:DNA invertase Pin-like site-specific DNA recombinase